MALSWRALCLGYDAYGQPSSGTNPRRSSPQPTYHWDNTAPGGFVGEDGYGSFASMDADLLQLPDNGGNSGMSLVPVYNIVRHPDDFAVASSSSRGQCMPTVKKPNATSLSMRCQMACVGVSLMCSSGKSEVYRRFSILVTRCHRRLKRLWRK